MITPSAIVQKVIMLLRTTPAVTALVPVESIFYSVRPMNHTGKCITVNTLQVTSAQLQRGLVNVNVFAPNLTLKINGTTDNTQPDLKTLRTITAEIVKVLDGYYEEGLELTVESMNDMQNESVPEWYTNIRVKSTNINI